MGLIAFICGLVVLAVIFCALLAYHVMEWAFGDEHAGRIGR